MKILKIKYHFFLLGMVIFTSCGMYSFTGVTISPEVKTVSIDYFSNNADIVNPLLSQMITDALKDRFNTQTNLSLVSRGGDLQFTGAITSYKVTPSAAKGNETSALTKLQVSIKIKFINSIEEGKDYDQTFTRDYEYDASLSLNEAENAYLEQIVTQLVDAAFIAAVVNW